MFAITLTLCWGIATPLRAAERVTLRLGPFKQSVNITDLEQFAETGEVSPALKPYSSLLTPQVRQLLSKRLHLDPNLTEKFIDDLLSSSDGARLLDQIGLALPSSSLEELKAALFLAARQADGLSALSFLRAYPDEEVTLDASSAIAIVLKLNTSYLQSLTVGPILEQELAVPDVATFRPSLDPTATGYQYVQERTLRLRDRERQRTILVDLYWARKTSGPLVILSHGFGSDRKFLTYLARHLASHGITVASLEHPGSNLTWLNGVSLGSNLGELLPASEFIDRPRDVSFVLDRLAQINQGYGRLRDKLNTQQVSIIGHSLGGYTALALAGGQLDLAGLQEFCKNRSPLERSPADWFQCSATELKENNLQLSDRRIVQAMALNAVTGRLFGKDGLTQVSIPTLILTGTDDAITPSLDHQLRSFAQLRGSKYLIAAIGGTHLSVTDRANLNDALAQSTFVKELTGKEAEPLRQLFRGVSLAFIKQLTPEAKTYEPFLTPAYAQSLSTPTLSLRLSTTLPPTMATWLQVLAVGNQEIALRLPDVNQWSIGMIKGFFFKEAKAITQANGYSGQLNQIFTNIINHSQQRLTGIS
ncbi:MULTISPECIES: alpha/beta hydrolase [unclassified Coleofasciculus]|uniref:alpha/beta hydrolase n=1 Tax=unclassified Coleofasciculus TaxID=2692782 RepID=UPI001D14DD39|nr:MULTISPECIES: alpha/beta hydrolase [unclassified Coleofasciculus]